MLELSRRKRQLASALRWRSLQFEKSQQVLARAMQHQRQLEQLQQRDLSQYRVLQEQYHRLIGIGDNLDPAMVEQRLLALMEIRTNVQTRQQRLIEARKAVQQATAAAAGSRLEMDAMTMAHDKVKAVAIAHAQEREQIEIFESGCRQGAAR
ncbi:MAG: hypothetical protein Q8L72_00830 [Moraxellaceae bacterium]|nr:hypothetical protein [Moraxellaceae bacterium]